MTLIYGSPYKRVLFQFLVPCALFFPASPALHAGTGTGVDFRVSGIIRVGEELYRGLVESPDGKKVIVRQGDIIDQWKVVRINENCIILSKEARTHEECLSGTGETESQKASKEAQSHKADAKKAVNPSDAAIKESMSHFKQVNKVALLQALDGLALKKGDVTMENISEAVLPLTDLPGGFHITEIEAQAPESGQNAINQMRQRLSNSAPIRLTVQNETGVENIIYLQTAAQSPGSE